MNTILALSCLILALVTVSIQAARMDSNLYAKYLCRNRENGFKALVPGSCSQYYECQNKVSVLRTCARFFDALKQKCIIKDSGCLKTLASEINAPAGCNGPCCGILNGFSLDPFNAQCFYECKDNCVVAKNLCTDNLMFNLETLKCNTPEDCEDQTTSETLQIASDTTKTPHADIKTTTPCTEMETTTCTKSSTNTITTPTTTITSTNTISATEKATTTIAITTTVPAITTTTCKITTTISCTTTTRNTEPTTTTCTTTTATTTCTSRSTMTTTATTTSYSIATTTPSTTASTPTTTTTTYITTKDTTTTSSTTKIAATITTTTLICSTISPTSTTKTPPEITTTTCTTTRTTTTTINTTTKTPTTTTATTTCSTTTTTTCRATKTIPPTTSICTTTKTKPAAVTTTLCITTTTEAPCTAANDVDFNQFQFSERPSNYDLYLRYVCRNMPDGFKIVSLKNCNDYYICRNGIAMQINCGKKYFNPQKGICDLPENAGCNLGGL